MKIDREPAKEIKAANGDGSREAKVALVQRVRAANKDLSTPTVTTGFNDAIKKHGRVPVALCIAGTLYARRERLDRWGFAWAEEVLKLWTNRPPSYIQIATINDGLHPTRICEYAGSFVRAVIEEGSL